MVCFVYPGIILDLMNGLELINVLNRLNATIPSCKSVQTSSSFLGKYINENSKAMMPLKMGKLTNPK